MLYSVINTIEDTASGEFIDKKSRFIANIYRVESVEEAEKKIKEVKRKYYDAKHNCFAFSVLEENQLITRMNDDGEPSGTAGEPILNVINKNNLVNILIIVTRYFGGILLGTGGLTRAYTNASIKALNNAKILELESGAQVKVEIKYEENGKFKYYCSTNNINIINIQYAENIFYILELNDKEVEKMKNSRIVKNDNNTINIISFVELCRKYVKKGK